jgi:uncharacterized protein involved in outer membrane biogenesis
MNLSKRSRRILLALAILAALLIGAVLLLPALIDVNSYRDTIEAQAEAALGRDVELGELQLTVFPRLGIRADQVSIAALPEEGGGDLVSAKLLVVGARLLPLLRKSLEVTYLRLDDPAVVLSRDSQGAWNVQKLVAGPAETTPEEAPAAGSGAGAFSVDHIRIRGGRITLRDAALVPGQTVEVVVTDLNLDLADVALDREMEIDLTAVLAGESPATVRLTGRAGPLAPAPGQSLRVQGSAGLEEFDPAAYGPLLEAFIGESWSSSAGLLEEGPISLAIDLESEWQTGADGALTPLRLDISRLRVEDVGIVLRRDRRGEWILPSFAGAEAAGGGGAEEPLPLGLTGMEIAGARIRVVDESAGGEPHELLLDKIDLTLDALPTAAPASVELTAEISGREGTGSLELSGTLGPLAADGVSLPADLELEIDDLPLALAGPYLRELLTMEPTGGVLGIATEISGDLRGTFETDGELSLQGAGVRVVRPDGSAHDLDLDVDGRYDLEARGGAAVLDFRSFELSVNDNTLALAGVIDNSLSLTRVDLTLSRSRIHADDLAALLSLADYPIGGDALPEMEGVLKLAEFTFRHPSMTHPMEQIGGTLSVRGETVEVTEFTGRLGSSDLAGELTLQGFTEPRVSFDFRSQNASFGELISFLTPADDTGSAPADEADGEAALPLEKVLAEGHLAIENGSFGSLAFTGLDAGLRMERAILTLAPFRMKLYDGSFDGKAVLDLADEPPRFNVESQVANLETSPLLAETLALGELLSGRLTGSLKAAGAGADFESIVRSLSGGGAIEVTDGRIGQLNALEMLSKATGVFGEQTLNALSQRLETEGTEFEELSTRVTLNGSQMKADDLLLAAPDLRIQGAAVMELLAAEMDGSFNVIFSDEMSRMMRAEDSRAAKVFWDSDIDQVNLPLTVAGPIDAPTPGIDWEAATGQYVETQVREAARDKLADLLGVKRESPAPPPEPTAPPEGRSPAAPAGPAGTPTGEVSRVRWGGNWLAPDLKLNGVVRGTGIDRVSLQVSDASGKQIKSYDRLSQIDAHFASGAARSDPAEIAWNVDIDGKKLLGASYPLTATLSVVDADGNRSTATREIQKK